MFHNTICTLWYIRYIKYRIIVPSIQGTHSIIMRLTQVYLVMILNVLALKLSHNILLWLKVIKLIKYKTISVKNKDKNKFKTIKGEEVLIKN